MKIYEKYTGFIFDWDDTVLLNYPEGLDKPGLHEMSRLLAIQHFGQKLGNRALVGYSAELNKTAFLRSPVHTAAGGIWQALVDVGVIENRESYEARHPLVEAVTMLKHQLHPQIISDFAVEVPGAACFMRALHEARRQIVVASTAPRTEIAFGAIHLGIDDIVNGSDEGNVVGYHDVSNHKPHPDVFMAARKKLVDQSGIILVFEDDPRGVESARLSGITTIWGVTTRKTTDELVGAAYPVDLVGTYHDFGTRLELPGY